MAVAHAVLRHAIHREVDNQDGIRGDDSSPHDNRHCVGIHVRDWGVADSHRGDTYVRLWVAVGKHPSALLHREGRPLLEQLELPF